jgi:hypothetical protein
MNKIFTRVTLVLALALGCLTTASASAAGYPCDRFPTHKLNDVPALPHGA